VLHHTAGWRRLESREKGTGVDKIEVFLTSKILNTTNLCRTHAKINTLRNDVATMSLAVPTPNSLEQFFALSSIEESPAWEFIYGGHSKADARRKYSRLQSRLVTAINATASL